MSRHLDMANEIFDRMFGVKRLPDIAPPMRPDSLDVIDMNNESINEIRDSQEREEDAGRMPRMDYGTTHEEHDDECH